MILIPFVVPGLWPIVCGIYATQSIKIEDVQGPQFNFGFDTLQVLSADFPINTNCDVTFDFDITGFVSDCSTDDQLVVTNNATQGDGAFDISGTYSIGDYMLYFTAMDVCGNVSQDSFLLLVKDNSLPTPGNQPQYCDCAGFQRYGFPASR